MRSVHSKTNFASGHKWRVDEICGVVSDCQLDRNNQMHIRSHCKLHYTRLHIVEVWPYQHIGKCKQMRFSRRRYRCSRVRKSTTKKLRHILYCVESTHLHVLQSWFCQCTYSHISQKLYWYSVKHITTVQKRKAMLLAHIKIDSKTHQATYES